ncbi:N-acetylglucosamine kinase [Amnibacterium sp.]|uniref:N-acetylglucosamine kinase n=1 Tax=Amnibacterium sp. TaxID=1872496 RepID=UPI00261D800F|nr:BadF/BadG/BcrA/BcrD ATPase family protein [Amnibacterium sp.]MCU1472964.1 N-acetylglucosamine kinase [Amnibacterium sp.]
MTGLPEVAIAVDGGGSKTDVVALDAAGTILAHARGTGSNPQVAGLPAAMRVIGDAVERVREEAGPHRLVRFGLYLAGLDLPAEIAAFRGALAEAAWAAGVPEDAVVTDYDLSALLEAGTDSPDAVAVVCGTGINAVGRAADGRTARFPALGMISGDWGGGGQLGMQALWHAARAEDGREPASVLTRLVPELFGLATVPEVTEALHFGRIPQRRIAELSPLLFSAARAGEPLALADVVHQADEIVLMATTALRRLELLDAAVPVVLGGGVLAAADPLLLDRIRAGLAVQAPRAHVELVTAPPIVGAVALVLRALGAAPAAVATAREAVELAVQPVAAG